MQRMIREVSLCKNNSALWKLSMLLRWLYYFSIIILPTTQPQKKENERNLLAFWDTAWTAQRSKNDSWRKWVEKFSQTQTREATNKLVFTHTVSFSNTNVVCNGMNWNWTLLAHSKSAIINVANYSTGFPWTTENCRLLLKALNLTSNFLLLCGRHAQFRENWTAPEPSDSPLWTIDSLLLHLRTDHRKVFLSSLSLWLSHPPAPPPSSPLAASALPLPGWRANSEPGEAPRFVHSPCPGSWLSPSGRRSSRSGHTGGSSSAARALCTRLGVEHFLTENPTKGK